MRTGKEKILAYSTFALAALVASPIDDIALVSVFGTALFGFGTTGFYLLLVSSTILSVMLWKKQAPRVTSQS